MGRRFPVADHHHQNLIQSNHPIVAWSIFIACIAATIAVVSSLCGVWSRKKSSSESPSPAKSEIKESPEDNADNSQIDEGTVPVIGTAHPAVAPNHPEDKNDGKQPEEDQEDYLKQPLPPPPAMQAAPHQRSHSTVGKSSTSNTSKGNLSSSLSMGVIGKTALSFRQSSRRVDDNSNDKNNKREKKLKHEDSVWKKTIILGEKCKVPDEGDDTIIYDEKGNRISTYHPRMSSVSASSAN